MIKVIKRTGDAVNLELSKILSAVRRANLTTSEEITPTTLDVFTSAILVAINNAVKDNVIQVEVIQDLVEGCLMGVGLHQTAKNYILYRSERNKGREEFLMLYNIIQSEDIKRILYTSRKTYNLPFRQLYDKYVSYKKDTTPELETLIKATAECTNMDNPKWDNVAGRLYYHKILVESKRNRANLGIDTNKHKEFYTKLIELGLYSEELSVYTEDELAYIIENSEEFHKEVQKYITYSAADLYYKRYLVRDYNGNILENIIQMFTRVGMFLAIPEASNKMYAALNFIKELATFRVTVATPTLSNAGKPKAQLSSCFIDTVEDSLDGIYESLHEFAKVSKWGGGMGIYMGKVRAVGSPIRGFKGKSGGIIRWVKLFNDTAVAVDQLGCVAKNSYVKVLDTVQSDRFSHSFLKRATTIDYKIEEDVSKVIEHAIKFIPHYSTISEEDKISLIKDYCSGDYDLTYLCSKYNLNRQQYKKFIGRFKSINKGLPSGFRIIKDYPEYAISESGSIISIVRLRLMKAYSLNRKNYITFTFKKDNCSLHRILYKTFIGDIPKEYTIDHIDGNPMNNSLDNLTLLPNSDNISKGWRQNNKEKRIEKMNIKAHLSNEKVLTGYRSIAKNRYIGNLNISTKTMLISEVKVGDLILSLNPNTNTPVFKEVLRTHDVIVSKENQIKIVYDGGSYIVTSLWHPTYTSKGNTDNFRFIRADEVKVGDYGMSENGEPYKVISVELQPDYDTDYKDLTVKDTECYFVSTDKEDNEMFLIHNTRSGSCAITLDIWHKDMPEFLQIRTNNGDDRMKAHDVFPAVSVPDLFWKLVDTNIEENWYMFCPHEVKTIMGFSLEDYYGEEWEAKYKECINNKDLPRRGMSVKDMARLIIKSSVETGTPFIFNRDTVNRANPNKHKGVIYSSNLCVSGDTRILTKLGYKRIQEVVDQNLEIWNGKEWSLSPIRKTSDGSMLLRIHFSNGQYIDCTEYHKFYKQEGFSGNGREIQVEAKDLQIGDRLIKFDLPIIDGTETLEHSYDNGFFTGDGTVVGKYKNYARIYLYNNKKVLVKYFSSIRNWRSSSSRLEAETSELRPKFFVPNSNFTIKSRIEWFMGLCDADGTIARNGNTCSLQITSTNKEFLVETMEMLNTLGIDCKVVKGIEEGFRKMPTHRVDITHKKYYCNKSYRLVVGNYSLVKLVKLGFKPHRLVITDNIPNRDATQFIKVTKVEHLVGFHPTYCVNEPKEHKVIFNSILTGNCVEIAQNMSSFTKEETDNIALSDKDYLVQETNKAGDYVVCNLASIVLSRFAGWHKNDNTKEALRTTVHTVVNMLDNGITMNNLPSEYANITNSIYRAIGIGTSGYHHLLALEGIAWESEDHLKYMDSLFEFINMCAIEASSNLAIQKGSYKVFEGSDWNTGKYFEDRGYNSEEWDNVKNNAMLGMRNAYLMAIAPTGSTSILVGTSPGIDPIQNKYFLEEKKGSIVPRVAPDLDDKTWWLYKEAHNINHEWTIRAAGIRQRHIDQSQSLNLFINHSYSFRDILNLYLLAWKEGVKTLYYIRSKSLEVEECVSCSS